MISAEEKFSGKGGLNEKIIYYYFYWFCTVDIF